MASTRKNATNISSPASTGGAGTVFEQHVNAAWLSLLLVRGIPPIMTDCRVVEVHLQTEHFGWHTDDFLLVGETGAGTNRRILGQVKRTFSVSSSDEECRKTIEGCWKDFQNTSQFATATDRIAIVTMRGTTVLLEHFCGLLDCARSSRDASEFERRLATPGVLSAKAISYGEEIQTIVNDVEGRRVSSAELWPFLRVLYIISLDLTTGTAQTEAMIKTLLAHTATQADVVGTAEATWNALLREVGEGAPQARSYRQTDLPPAIRDRHAPVSAADDRMLRALREHSLLILGGIRTDIGSKVHLPRRQLTQEILTAAELTQVVVVSGAAGSGKSGAATVALRVLANDHFTFCFRAEEFACPHLDETFQKALVQANGATIGAILAGQARKVLLVESIERLLEASTRSAFADLLLLIRKDPSWRLILTCRDYSTDLVRSALLESVGVKHSVVDVPQLDDGELAQVQEGCPNLVRPLSNPSLRKLLSSPYLLDKAAVMEWPENRPLPEGEREFREKFWREVIRADERAYGGMPRRREDTFMHIALRRAKALSVYVPRTDLDSPAVDLLHHDSLVIFSQESNSLVAPAHDVLEDWAILRWIDEQNAAQERSLSKLSTALGTFPAIRRTYRKWLFELVERNSDAADSVFQCVATDGSLSAQFSDDTVVSLLRSPEASRLIERHHRLLFANEKRLLHRVIHLLRVGCVKAPAWAGSSSETATLYHVPDGLAWASVLKLVHDHLTSFSEDEHGLLLGLIEDWATGVTWETPYPPGANSAAAIAYHLLGQFDDYTHAEQRKRTLQVVAKIPNAESERFKTLLIGHSGDAELDDLVGEFQKIVLDDIYGTPACRDQPSTVIDAARKVFLLTDDDLEEQEWGFHDSTSLEPHFGIKQATDFSYFPASSTRGVFLPLLRHHPRAAVAFLIEIFNHSAEWYAHPRTHREYIEPPFEITLSFTDGSQRKQWCNGRLWNLYRGTSVGPYVLQTALMALEQFLLELAELVPDALDEWLLQILKNSTSAALTSVVAGVATAFPHRAGETLLVLLRSRECVRLDKMRLMNESQVPSKVAGIIPLLQPGKQFYVDERNAADAKPHRRHDLEAAVANLQLGPLGARVYEAIDAHRASLPPMDEQSEEDRVWRLALHRMDLRQYEVSPDAPTDQREGDSDESAGPKHNSIRLDLKVPDADIREMVEQNAAECEVLNARIGLLMWGIEVLYRDGGKHDPAIWRDRLQQARATLATQSNEEAKRLGEGGPSFVAAVCVRDHWEELTDEERGWCATTVCAEVERESDRWDQMSRMQRYRMSADRGCAWVIANLIGQPVDSLLQKRILNGLVLALTHPNDEVRFYALSGIGQHLWTIDRALTMRCVNALATEAILVQATLEEERRLPFASRRRQAILEAQAAYVIREGFFDEAVIGDDAYQAFDPTDWIGSEINAGVLTILTGSPTEPATIQGFERLATVLVQWWDADDDRRSGQRESHSHDVEMQLADLLANALLRVPVDKVMSIVSPLLSAIDRHTRDLSYVVNRLIGIEDRIRHTDHFWSVWQHFADGVASAPWVSTLDDGHSLGTELLSAVFVTMYWKKESRSWTSLEGHADRVHTLFETLPASASTLDNYVRFLYHIGEQSLPNAFMRIANRLRSVDSAALLRMENTVYMLEAILRRYVYSRPLELKRDSALRNAVIDLLDRLVERGSSAAYRMRDDFVTPISAG